MATSFELMDLDSGNLVGSYHSLEEALEVVRDAYAAYGQPGVADLGLVRVESGGSQERIAIGAELIEFIMNGSIGLDTIEPVPVAHNNGSKERTRSGTRNTRPH